MLLKKLVPVISFVLFISNLTNAQQNDPAFTRMPNDNGIALNLVYDMMQDSHGFLWFGTIYGLVRFDGENYLTYKYNPEDSASISFNDIVSLFEDRKGNLWIGTWGGGLNMFDPVKNKFTRYVHENQNPNSVSDNIIWAFCEDKNGKIWIGTGTSGINILDPETKKIIKLNYELGDSSGAEPNIRNMIADDNSIWIAHSEGLSRVNIKSSVITNYTHSNENTNSLSSNRVNDVYKDSKGNIWICTSDGLNKFNPSDETFERIYFKEVQYLSSIDEDDSGRFWIGTGNGLIIFNPSDEFYNIYQKKNEGANTLYSNRISKILIDKSGVVWLDSYNLGITKCITAPPKFRLYQNKEIGENSLSGNYISALTGNVNQTYIALYNKGINVLNNDGSINRISLPLNNRTAVQSLIVRNDILWIGTNNSLLAYDTKLNKTISPPLPKEIIKRLENIDITCLLADSSDNFWLGTNNEGVYKYNFNSENLKYFDLSKTGGGKASNYILSLYEDLQKCIWIGTYAGIFLFEAGADTFNIISQKMNDSAGLSNNYVYTITEDHKGNIWIGTANGLNKLSLKDFTFEKYFSSDGLPGYVIFGIVEDYSGYLWLSTNKGLSRFDPLKIIFVNFNETDGLQGNLFNNGVYYKSLSGNIFFGGRNGLNVFDPEKIKLSNYNAPVLITGILLKDNDGNFSSSKSGKKNIELGYNQNSIKFEFASIDYSNPSNNHYQYFLSSYNDDWVQNGTENSVQFSNLPPGDYTFRVKGTNSDGVWSDQTASLSFTINPPFWQTWWFITAMLLAIIIISLLIHKLIVNSKVKRAIEIEKIKEEESERIRKKTSVDFHDELGHRLTRISLLTELIRKKLGFTFTDIQELLYQISENSNRLYDDTKDFIWSIDPHRDTFYDLMIRLKDFGDDIFTHTQIDFNVDGITDELNNMSFNMDLKRHLTMIFKEGLNNSLRYSKSNKVILSSALRADEFEIILEDNGIGFETDDSYKGNGLKNMKKRAETLNADFVIVSEPGKGTRISLKGKFAIKSVNYN